MSIALKPVETWQTPLVGRHLPADTLASLSHEPTVLVFLRHFG